MLGHVAQSVGGALPGAALGLGLDFSRLNILQFILVPRIGNSDAATLRDYICPTGTRSVYIQCWGHGAARDAGGGGGAWASDMIDAMQGDVIRTSMPSRPQNPLLQPTEAILNGVTVRAACASGGIGGRAANSVGRWVFSGGNATLRGGGLSGGNAAGGTGGGAGGGHFTPGGDGVGNQTGLTPGGGNAAGNFAPGQSQIILVILGDNL